MISVVRHNSLGIAPEHHSNQNGIQLRTRSGLAVPRHGTVRVLYRQPHGTFLLVSARLTLTIAAHVFNAPVHTFVMQIASIHAGTAARRIRQLTLINLIRSLVLNGDHRKATLGEGIIFTDFHT